MFLGACGGSTEEPGTDAGQNPNPTGSSCTRVPALIDQRAECRSDDLCPCGTHCELGQCTATCRADTDCTGATYCDDFGRCRERSSTERIAPLSTQGQTRSELGVFPPVLYVADNQTSYFVTVRPSNGKAGPARVVARGDVELTCETGAPPASECNFAEVPVEGKELSIRFRTIPGARLRESEQAIVEIFDAAGHSRSILGLPVSAAAAPIEGTYLGYASLEGPGQTSADGAIRSQTKVLVFQRSGSTILSITDQIGGVLDGALVLQATNGTSGAISARLPKRIAYSGATHDGTSAEIVVSSTTAGAGRLGDGYVELVFPVRIFGLDLEGSGIKSRLVISAHRSDDLPEGAAPGTPTTDAVPTQNLLRGREESPLSAAARGIAEAGDPLTRYVDRAPFDQSNGTTVAACFASDAEVASALEGTRQSALTVASACRFIDESHADFQRRDSRYISTPGGRDCTPVTEPDGLGLICAATGQFYFGPKTYDACDAMAAQLGCVVMPSPPKVIYFLHGDGIWTDVVGNKMCWFDTSRFTIPTDRQCLGTTACFDEAEDFAQTATFTESLSMLSGDPGCRGETTFGVLEAADQEPDTIITQCTQDLSRDLASVPSFEGAFGSAGCVDRARFRLRLEMASRTIFEGRHDPAVEGMVSHLVQQWLQVHAMVARIGLNQLREALVLAAAGDPTADAVAALETSMGVWSNVLQPSVAGALLATSTTALQNPDPRLPLGFDVTDAVATARIGVSVDLLETAAEQAEMLDALLNRAWLEGNVARLDARRATAAKLLRIAAIASALAERLHVRANSAGASSWETAWARALPRFQLATQRLSKRVELTMSGANPIGIEDSDLPLYYRGAPLTAEDRFGATSRFLAGEGTGSTGIAPAAIDRARTALDAARARWAERRSVRDLGDRRIQDIKFRYGELITGYCGASIENDTNYAGPGQTPCINPGSQSVFDCAEIDTEYCFVEEECRPRRQQFAEELTAADLGYSLCIGTGLRAQYGASLIGLTRDLDVLLSQIEAQMAGTRTRREAFPLRINAFNTPSPNVRTVSITFDGEQLVVPLDALGSLDVRLPEAALRGGLNSGESSPYRQLVTACEASRQKTLLLRPTAGRATCTIADDCHRDNVCRNGRCAPVVRTDPLDTVNCYYDGAISEQAIAVRGAANDVDIAAAEFDDLSQRYDIAKTSCLLLKAGGDLLESETAKHVEVMNRLDAGRTAIASIEAVAAAGKDCVNSIAGADPLSKLGAAPACGFAAAEAAAKIGGAVLEQEMNEAERAHDATMLRIQNQTDLRICFNDAELELVGARAAAIRILRAQQDQATAIINLRGQKSYTLGLFNEGHAAVLMEQARLARSLPSQFALSEAAELFTTRMAYAQRVTYLAVRAAEYEFQTSLQARQQVVAATRPDQLESALQTVLAFVNANRVGGASPGSLHAVLSLREHLLQLGDRSGDPAGQLRLTDEERFRLLLTSSTNSVYDAGGVYLGQLIPFSLSPLGRLGRGNSQGIPILADNDCAERVWSVNAAVLGEGVFTGNASSFTRLDLLKMNTFYSQRCTGGTDGSPFQVASVRPAVNLFFDPADPNRTPIEASAAAPYTRGRMQPYLNVSRSEFEKEDYSQGATAELAGRGLYGDYALFIPAGVVSVGGSEGLKLEKIDDILLRLDYVSVAKN